MMLHPTAKTLVAGVIGAPIAHSLSPSIHNAWLSAAEIDAVYVSFSPSRERVCQFLDSLRGGVVRGLNVTAPFKETVLSIADRYSDDALRIGAANLVIFESDGAIVADNTDGIGLMTALAAQAPLYEPKAGPALIIGAGGAARGAAFALVKAGVTEVRIINRSLERAETLARLLPVDSTAYPMSDARRAVSDAVLIVNATTLGLNGIGSIDVPIEGAGPGTVIMDMNYKPVVTQFLRRANAIKLTTVDGLDMLIGQAIPSFTQLFGRKPPNIDIRSIALSLLEQRK